MSLGPLEITMIVLVLLLLFGGRKIPELMRGLGTGMKEFKKATSPEEEIETRRTGDRIIDEPRNDRYVDDRRVDDRRVDERQGAEPRVGDVRPGGVHPVE